MPTFVDEEFDIPEMVTTIGDYALAFCDKMPSVTIGSAVATIGENAFEGCSALGNVVIPNSVVTIGANAFNNCIAMTDAVIGDGVEAINEQTFVGCKALANVTIGESVKTIGANAFEGCAQLAEVTIPDATTAIGADAFKGCTGMKKVSLGRSVSSIGKRVWADCAAMETVENWSENPCAAPRDLFNLKVYDTATLNIPTGCMSKYMDVLPWYYFYNIRESLSGLSDAVVDGSGDIDYDAPYDVYGISGVKVGSSVDNLAPGGYIIRQGMTAKKVEIR